MRAYSNMPGQEFIAQLRDSAIRNGSHPLVIDQLDRLLTQDEVDAELEKVGKELFELEKVGEKLSKMEDSRDEWKDLAQDSFQDIARLCTDALYRAGDITGDDTERANFLQDALDAILTAAEKLGEKVP